MKTTAQKIAALLGDGQRYRTAEGEDFYDLMLKFGGREECREKITATCHGFRSETMVRFDFADGSCIVDCGDAWDLGVELNQECFCWAGVGHDHNCMLLGDNQ